MVGKYGVNKPLIADNDGGGDADVTGRRRKAWAALTAGGHVDYFHFSMYQQAVLDSQDVTDGMRYVGYTRKFLQDLAVDLRGMQPSDSLVSNGWCYAKSGERYVLYLMNGGSTTVSGLPASYVARWFNPRDGLNQPAAGGPTFTAPNGNDWVLYIAGLPAQVTGPSPPNGAMRTSFQTTLSWSAAAGATSYNVYFGKAGPGVFQGNQTQTNFDPGGLDVLTAYYWRIDSVNAAGTTVGVVWTFTTGGAWGDMDADGDADQADFGQLQICFSGPGAPPIPPECLFADMNNDGLVDESDFDLFHRCMSGPNLLVNLDCAH
jgi:hypothetical protein